MTTLDELCYNISTFEIDRKSIYIFELFIQQWMDDICNYEHDVKIIDRFQSNKVDVVLTFANDEDAFLCEILNFPDFISKFKSHD